MKTFTKKLLDGAFQLKIHTNDGLIIKTAVIGRKNKYYICETITNDDGEQMPWMVSDLYDKQSYYNSERGNRFYFSDWEIDFIEIPEYADFTVHGHKLKNENPGCYNWEE